MRIAIWHNLPSGGGKRALYDHVRGLVEQGHTVESWSPSTAAQDYLPLGEIITEHILPLKWPSGERNGRRYGPLGAYREMLEKIAAMDRHCRDCAKEINRGGFDVLFANSCMFFRAAPIGRHVEIPKVLYLQEPYRWLYEARPRLPWRAIERPERSRWSPGYLRMLIGDQIRVNSLRLQAREEFANAQAFDLILVNSLFSRESILRAYGLDGEVCYLGVDTELFSNQDRPREDFCIGIGAFVPEKNISFVIQAIAAIKEPRPTLVWVGNAAYPEYLKELESLAKSLAVNFVPQVKIQDAKIVDLLNRAALMVYAPRLEPFGLVPLEANACGCPVVAVAEGGVRETVIDGVNGLLVEHSIDAFARAIERLERDPNYARALGTQGRQLVVEKWGCAAAADRLEQRLLRVAGVSAQRKDALDFRN